jgi:hypothetical protein
LQGEAGEGESEQDASAGEDAGHWFRFFWYSVFRTAGHFYKAGCRSGGGADATDFGLDDTAAGCAL